MNPKKTGIQESELSEAVIDVPKNRKNKAVETHGCSSPVCMLSHVPNAATRKAIENADKRNNLSKVQNIEELLKDLDS